MSRMLVVACLVLATVACGKKGPLLPPYVRQAAAAEVTSTRRVGNDVYVTVTVPKADIDGATPASLASIEVWAMTAQTPPPPGEAFFRGATLVRTIPVARDAEPGDRSGKVVPDPTTGALQGQTVTIRESLTPEEFVPRQLPAPRGATPAAPTDTASTPQPPSRYYLTQPVGCLSPTRTAVTSPLSTLPQPKRSRRYPSANARAAFASVPTVPPSMSP